MPTELSTEIATLRRTCKAAAASPFLPAPVRDSITQACTVIEALAVEVQALRRDVDAPATTETNP